MVLFYLHADCIIYDIKIKVTNIEFIVKMALVVFFLSKLFYNVKNLCAMRT
jgi:hypothetical protein